MTFRKHNCLLSILLGTQLMVSTSFAAAVAEQQESPAKGTKSCEIQNIQSEYLEAKYQADLKQYGAAVKMQAPIVVYVHKGGSVAVGVIADTYPGTRTYVAIDGHRYSGKGSVTVPVGPLLKEKLVQFTYTSWPWNSDVNGEDVLAGFAAAYAECRAFMGG